VTSEELERISNEELKIDQYPFSIRVWCEEDGGGFLIEYPDIPGCMSDGESPEEAIHNGKDALRCVLLTMMAFGDPIPEPGTVGKMADLWSALPAPLRVRLLRQAEREHTRIEDLLPSTLEKGLDSAA
jgi:antitoxin HicB